jgi:hypothetical protein
MANHEFVWVSHDYVTPLPSFYAGMRSFGRGASWLVPGFVKVEILKAGLRIAAALIKTLRFHHVHSINHARIMKLAES